MLHEDQLMKNITHRISYYVRKVAERWSIHPSKKPPRAYTYRAQRLLKYKTLMHQQIENL